MAGKQRRKLPETGSSKTASVQGMEAAGSAAPEYEDVLAASERNSGFLVKTPVLAFPELNRRHGLDLLFKYECVQTTGSFKARGALNAVMSMDEAEVREGVVTHSSGNHGAALAFAASRRSASATVVVPEGALPGKKANVLKWGGQIVECEFSARSSTVDGILREKGGHLVHPYNDRRIIAGQGTCFDEFAEQAGELDAVIAPVGGGGLISGTCISARAPGRSVRVFAGEPALADDARRSFVSGNLVGNDTAETIADGLRAPLLDQTWAIISQEVEDILIVDDGEIVEAMRIFVHATGRLIEPSSAVALAAVLGRPERFRGLRTGVILTGGNVDLDELPESVRRALKLAADPE